MLLFFDPKNTFEVKEAKALAHDLATTAIEMGGTCTGEHGVGIGKKMFLSQELGQGTISVMRKIKEVLDPKEILNPGKILDEKGKKKLC